MENHQLKLYLQGLDCANCANKIEAKVAKIDGVEEANLNFSIGLLDVEYEQYIEEADLRAKIEKIVKTLEPDVEVLDYSLKNAHDTCNSCNCHAHGDHHGHEHGEHCHCHGEEHDHSEHGHEHSDEGSGGFSFKDNWKLFVGIAI